MQGGNNVMFLVFNKQKIYSYLVALSTVIVLFFVASLYSNKSEEIIQTVSNIKNDAIENQALNQCNKLGEKENKTNEVAQNECKNETNNNEVAQNECKNETANNKVAQNECKKWKQKQCKKCYK